MPKSTIIPSTMINPKRLITFMVTPAVLRPIKATMNTTGIVAVTRVAILTPRSRKSISASRIKPVIAFVITESIVFLVNSLVMLNSSMLTRSGLGLLNVPILLIISSVSIISSALFFFRTLKIIALFPWYLSSTVGSSTVSLTVAMSLTRIEYPTSLD